MPSVFSLVEFAARMEAAAHDTEVAKHEIIEEACRMVAGKAKSLIGVPHSFWPPLQPKTLRRKDGVNTPLLETGELRDSIEWTAEETVGYVGSNNDKAVWHELGTSRGIPPRSFLASAAMMEAPKIEKMAASMILSAIAGRGETGTRVTELFHLLREASHAFDKLKEVAQDFVDDSEQERERR